MAITLLTADPSTVDGTSFASTAVTPAGNAGIVVCTLNTKATTPDSPSFSSPSWLSGAWANEAEVEHPNADARMTIKSGRTVASPGSDLLTVSFGATQTGCIIIIVQATEEDLADFVLQPAIVSSSTAATSGSATLAGALAAATSRCLAFVAHLGGNTAISPTGGETELADVGYATPGARMSAQFEVNDTTSGGSWTGSDHWFVGILEVKEAGVQLGRIFKRIVGPRHLGDSASDLYTVPAGARAVIRHIHVFNGSDSTVNFTLSIGNDAAATRLWDAFPVPARGMVRRYRKLVLQPGEKIQGFASVTGTATITISGYENIV